jgi:hypothetical protein
MAGPVPAIHAVEISIVDARHKAGHDDLLRCAPIGRNAVGIMRFSGFCDKRGNPGSPESVDRLSYVHREASAMYKAVSFAGAMLAGAFWAGSAADNAVAADFGYGYAPPAYAAPAYAAPAYVAPTPSVTVVINPPAATYVAPAAPAYAYTSPSYAAPAYYEARPVPPAPIPSPAYSYGAPAPDYAAEIDYDYADSGYAYAPARSYVAPGYASSAPRVCWHDSFGARHCRWR